MPRLRHVLTDLHLRALVSKGEQVARSDGDGLTFTLSKAGTATWVLRYRQGRGRRKELTIGNFPDIGLSEARKLASRHRVSIDEGGDPAAQKKLKKAQSHAAWSVRNLIEDYTAKKLVLPLLAENTIYYRKWDLAKIILPSIGSLEVRAITASEIVHMIESSGRSWTINKRILTTATQLFAHACGKRIITSNPCIGIDLRSLLGPRPPVRKRVMLTKAELSALLKGIEEIGTDNALAFRILLATCVRSIELEKAKWEHIDFERNRWWVPAESVKTRTGFVVPLAPMVSEYFKQLRLLAGDSQWVLPARTERRKRFGDVNVGSNTLWAGLTRAFERGSIATRKFTPHDTRSTAKGHLRNLGVSNEISELALNHKLKGMEAIYDVRDDVPERIAALEKWALFLQNCEMI